MDMIRRWWWRRKNRSESNLQASYWNTFFRAMAIGLLGIFVPIYVYLIGVEWGGGWKTGVVFLMFFLVLTRLTVIVAVWVTARLIEVKGFRWSITVAGFLGVVYYGLLVMAERSVWWLVPASVVLGFEIVLYWIPRLSMNVDFGHKERMGKEIGVRNMINRGSSVLGPFAGGVIAGMWGFDILFGVGVSVLVMSLIPIYFMEKHKHEDGVGFGDLVSFWKDEKQSLVSFWGQGIMDGVSAWIWPLFVFIVIGSLEELGAVTSAALGVSMLGVFLASKSFDWLRSFGGDEDERLFVTGNVITAVMMVVRGLARGVWSVFGLDLLYQAALPWMSVPLYGYIYTLAERKGVVRVISYREIFYSLGVVLVAVVGVVVLMWPGGWQIVFGIGALGGLMTLPMRKESNQ